MAKIIFQISRKKFAQIIKNHKNNSEKYNALNILGGVNIKLIEGKWLRFASTDGNRLLVTELTEPDIIDIKGKVIDVTFDLSRIAPIKFLRGIKSYDLLVISIDTRKGMVIEDQLNSIVYKIPIMTGKFPNYEKLVDFNFRENKKRQSVFLNKRYLKEILDSTAANSITNVIELNINKEDQLQNIYVAGKDTEFIETFSLLMPCQVK